MAANISPHYHSPLTPYTQNKTTAANKCTKRLLNIITYINVSCIKLLRLIQFSQFIIYTDHCDRQLLHLKCKETKINIIYNPWGCVKSNQSIKPRAYGCQPDDASFTMAAVLLLLGHSIRFLCQFTQGY